MSKQGGGGGGQGEDDSYSLLWILGSIFVIGGLIWWFYSEKLKYAFLMVKKYELLAISFFIHSENVKRGLEGVNMALGDQSLLTMFYTNQISHFIGQFLMYPICFVLVILAVIMFKGTATMRFTKAYNMDTLMQQEKENYPQIAPIVGIDLMAEDISKGPWAMSQNPMQFARAENLLKVEMIADRKAAWKADGLTKATVIKEKAQQVFASQLGPLWSGVDNLPPHTKALYAVFLARAEHDTDACRGYLAKLSRSAAKGTIDYSDTEEFLKKYGKCKGAKLCQSRHAYVSTLMASMLVLARVDGVLASSDFLWVKPIDRRLWYTLNCVGRQVAVPEVGGVFAHWLAEKEMGRPLSVPMVDEAVKALELAVANMVYIPAEGEEIPPQQTVG